MILRGPLIVTSLLCTTRVPEPSMMDPRDRPHWRQKYRKLLPFEDMRKTVRQMGLDTKKEYELNTGGLAHLSFLVSLSSPSLHHFRIPASQASVPHPQAAPTFQSSRT